MLAQQLDESLHQFLRPHCVDSCLVIVAPHLVTLRAVADHMAATYTWPYLTIGRELSVLLLKTPPKARAKFIARWLNSRVQESESGPVTCTDIDLLFEPALHLNPLVLFQQASRRTPLVLIWPGSYHDGVLAYAAPEHAHYRVWKELGVMVVDVGQTF